MNVRSIEEDDIDGCADLFVTVFTEAPWQEPWDKNSALARLMHFYQSPGFVGVLTETDEISGFVIGNWEPFHFGSMFYLREMCVKPNQQGLGLGGKMYSELEKRLKEHAIASIYLTTERAIPAASFYQKHGFKFSETMGFYAKGISS